MKTLTHRQLSKFSNPHKPFSGSLLRTRDRREGRRAERRANRSRAIRDALTV